MYENKKHTRAKAVGLTFGRFGTMAAPPDLVKETHRETVIRHVVKSANHANRRAAPSLPGMEPRCSVCVGRLDPDGTCHSCAEENSHADE